MEQTSKSERYKLSVLVPAKRFERWEKLYNSIRDSFAFGWELVIITAYDLPDCLREKSNITVINSHRSPLHKQQIGLTKAKGDYITCLSDDTIFEPNFITNAWGQLTDNYKDFFVCKYVEGDDFHYPDWYLKERPDFKTNWEFMMDDSYYYQNTHLSSDYKHTPPESLILSNAIMSRQLLLELGGWDCMYHAVPMANNDLAIRMINYGCTGRILPGLSQKCGFMYEGTGDHSSLHLVQYEHDEPLFKKIYNGKDNPKRTTIPINNWKDTPEIWEWRSGIKFIKRNRLRELKESFVRADALQSSKERVDIEQKQYDDLGKPKEEFVSEVMPTREPEDIKVAE